MIISIEIVNHALLISAVINVGRQKLLHLKGCALVTLVKKNCAVPRVEQAIHFLSSTVLNITLSAEIQDLMWPLMVIENIHIGTNFWWRCYPTIRIVTVKAFKHLPPSGYIYHCEWTFCFFLWFQIKSMLIRIWDENEKILNLMWKRLFETKRGRIAAIHVIFCSTLTKVYAICLTKPFSFCLVKLKHEGPL